MRDLLGRAQLVYLLASPPALFSRLFSLRWYREMLERWVEPLLPPRGEVLEAGCAAGDFARTLASSQRQLVAVDRSMPMLRRATSTPSEVRFVLADAESLPFQGQRFDLVLAASLFNVVANPGTLLAELGRVCKPGGLVSVLVPNRSFTDVDARQLVQHEQLSGFSRAALLAWYRLGNKMDADTVCACFQECGLRDVRASSLLNGMVLVVTGVVA
jgi:ubiquinone/menaquinone biosynthesis C-methylase UbiE